MWILTLNSLFYPAWTHDDDSRGEAVAIRQNLQTGLFKGHHTPYIGPGVRDSFSCLECGGVGGLIGSF